MSLDVSIRGMKQFDGSRRHVLDWVETSEFHDTVQSWVEAQGLNIPENARRIPQSWAVPSESRLFNASSPFLPDETKAELRRWWLVHSGNIPNWDLIVEAFSKTGETALVLVEAKAHSGEFDCGPKPLPSRGSRDAQERSDQNHEQIRLAIESANAALSKSPLGISISIDHCYQLANRIATAWKLASLGIPNTLVFLGFTGDHEIGSKETFFTDDSHWQSAFESYSKSFFPHELMDRDICCGKASFRAISRSLPVARFSRVIAERRGR